MAWITSMAALLGVRHVNRLCCAHAQAHEVEQQLWKAVYYRPIEEFRRRLKQAADAATGKVALPGVSAADAAEQVSRTIAVCSSSKPRQHLLRPRKHVARGRRMRLPCMCMCGIHGVHTQWRRVAITYSSFLADSVARYSQLLLRLQAAYGKVPGCEQVPSVGGAPHPDAPPLPQQQKEQRVDCTLSVHRTLVYLGDLCRYASQESAGC